MKVNLKARYGGGRGLYSAICWWLISRANRLHVDDSQAKFVRATKEWFNTRKRRIVNDALRMEEDMSREYNYSSSSSSGVFILLTNQT
jgi:hypothetical protein